MNCYKKDWGDYLMKEESYSKEGVLGFYISWRFVSMCVCYSRLQNRHCTFPKGNRMIMIKKVREAKTKDY